jgi:hypothetical protein
LIAVALFGLATSARADPVDTVVHGATLSGSFTTAPVGDAILGELGGAWGGLRTIDRRWVLQWEMRLAIEAGWLGSEHPFLFLVGPHASSMIEAGHRFRSERPFSPYLGVRLAGDARSLASPGAPSQEELNAVDGVGGNVAHGALRVVAGSSYLDEAHALIIAMFVQEEVDAPEIHTPGLAFTDIGLEARYDATRSLTLSLEGRCGLTFDRHDALLGTTDSTMRCGFDAAFRKIFGNGMWLGATISFRRDTDHVGYANGASYETGDAPLFVGALELGVPLWRTR